MTAPGNKPCPYCAGFGLPKCQARAADLACTRAPGHDNDHVSCDVLGIHARHTWANHDDGKENDGEEAQRAAVRTPRT